MSQASPNALPTPGGSKVPPPVPMKKGPPQQNTAADQDQLEEELGEESGLPPWFDVAAPWMASIVFHLGIGLLVLFLAWTIVKAAAAIPEAESIVIPTSLQDISSTPGGQPNPGEMNSSRDSAQDKIKAMKSDGWAQSESNSNVASVLSGATGEQAVQGIFLGKGGSTGGSGGNGLGSGGPIAPYGTPGGGMGSGPKSNFFGNGGGGAYKIVYIIDHSGSLLDNFDFLREEVKRSVGNLLPVQQFAVVAFSEETSGNTVLAASPMLQRATSDTRRDLAKRIDELKAMGENDDMLDPFKYAFQQAFAMKPQLIYFLTDGKFDPKLFDAVAQMNVNHKVRINTLAFVTEDAKCAELLQKLAKGNGGTYKFVSEKDLGK